MTSEEEARFYQRLAERVRLARQQAGVQQKELAARIGVSQPTMAQMENGSIRISLWYLNRIAAEVGIPVSVFLGSEDPSLVFQAANLIRSVQSTFVTAPVPTRALVGVS